MLLLLGSGDVVVEDGLMCVAWGEVVEGGDWEGMFSLELSCASWGSWNRTGLGRITTAGCGLVWLGVVRLDVSGGMVRGNRAKKTNIYTYKYI